MVAGAGVRAKVWKGTGKLVWKSAIISSASRLIAFHCRSYILSVAASEAPFQALLVFLDLLRRVLISKAGLYFAPFLGTAQGGGGGRGGDTHTRGRNFADEGLTDHVGTIQVRCKRARLATIARARSQPSLTHTP